MINLERVYDGDGKQNGARFLVERLWPRGVKKTQLHVDGWLRDVAPSTGLRQWFGHDPEKWDEFRRRYGRELDTHPEVWAPILDAARHGTVTLVFSSRDVEHNNAVALKAYLEQKLRRPRSGSGARRGMRSMRARSRT